MLNAYKPKVFVPVVVIGAGPTGLAASFLLKQAQIEHLLLERSDTVARSWYNLWDNYRLAMAAEYVVFPGVDFGKAFGKLSHPKRDELIAFFKHYAKTHELPIKYNTEVHFVYKQGNNQFFIDTPSTVYVCNYVICCIGPRQVPHIPPEVQPLINHDEAIVLHSSYYRKPTVFSPNSNCLVIGSGASALSIALDLQSAGHQVSLACAYTSDEIREQNKHLYDQASHIAVVPLLDDLITKGIKNHGRLMSVHGNTLLFAKNNQFSTLSLQQFSVIILATGYTRSFQALNNMLINLQDSQNVLAGMFIAGIPQDKQQTVIINQGTEQAQAIVEVIKADRFKPRLNAVSTKAKL